MKNQIPLFILIAIIFTGGGFFGGMKYQQSKRNAAFGNRMQEGSVQGFRTGQGQGGNRMGFRPVTGEIISSDDKSITVKTQDGGSKIIILSDKTEIN